MIRCVISDMGRVIIFFDNSIFFEKMEKYCPFSREKIAKMAFGNLELVHSFDRGEINPKEFYMQVIKKLKARVEYDDFYAIYNDIFSLNAPVLSVLKRLKSKYRLVLLSNTDIMRFEFIKRKFPEVMIFDEYVLSFEEGIMKPHPRIYLEVLRKAGVEARECVFIDDRKENIQAATGVGIKGVLFEPQTNLEVVLREMGLCF